MRQRIVQLPVMGKNIPVEATTLGDLHAATILSSSSPGCQPDKLSQAMQTHTDSAAAAATGTISAVFPINSGSLQLEPHLLDDEDLKLAKRWRTKTPTEARTAP